MTLEELKKDDELVCCLAELMLNVFADIPCNVNCYRDEWCKEHCQGRATIQECWIHAIKAGWLER